MAIKFNTTWKEKEQALQQNKRGKIEEGKYVCNLRAANLTINDSGFEVIEFIFIITSPAQYKDTIIRNSFMLDSNYTNATKILIDTDKFNSLVQQANLQYETREQLQAVLNKLTQLQYSVECKKVKNPKKPDSYFNNFTISVIQKPTISDFSLDEL